MAYTTNNPVGSTDPRDLYDNAGNLDNFVNGDAPFYPDRMGKQRFSWSGMEQDFQNSQQGREAEFQQFLADSAFVFIGDYAAGLNFTSRSQYTIRDGVPYRVAPSTTLPYLTTGSWATEQGKFTPINSDDILRQDLAPTESTVMVGGQPASAIGALATALSVDPDGRARAQRLIIGTESLSGAARRDAIVVGRNLTGLTDCHAFADRTIMDGVTDAGTYGVFDATTRLRGTNNQAHVYAFQHRCVYEGSGSLQQFAGLLSRPVHAGTGSINESYGADIGSLSVTSGGTISSQYGVRIRDQLGATANVGLFIDQTSGNSIYSPGGAPMYHKGRAGFGVVPSTAYAVQFSGSAVGARRGFIETTAANLQIGAEADGPVQIVSNSAVRLQIRAAGNGYSVVPGADNAQALGDASARWSVVWAGTATISTSDAREKTEVRKLTAAEIAAASDLAKEIGAYKFLSAVAEKGEDAREHVGMTVQRAIEVMESHGLDPFGYSFICYDKWEEEVVDHPAEVVEHPAVYSHSVVVDGNGIPLETLVCDARTEVVREAWKEIVREAGDLYSFRESGLYAFISAGFEARISEIEKK